eukprot:2797026-Amphidinium_carterae.1
MQLELKDGLRCRDLIWHVSIRIVRLADGQRFTSFHTKAEAPHGIDRSEAFLGKKAPAYPNMDAPILDRVLGNAGERACCSNPNDCQPYAFRSTTTGAH